jgi:hypothetical protein
MQRSHLSLVALLAIAVASLALTGCPAYTCDGACAQYYGEAGCNKPSVNPTAEGAWDPLAQCSKDCQEAMYTTTASTGGQNAQNYRVLENQVDAMHFINDITERDYSDAAFNATCEDLEYSGWFQW